MKLSNMVRMAAARFGLLKTVTVSNIAEGTHENSLTKLTDAAITTRFLLVKNGTDVDHIAVCGANELPIGPCTDESSAAEQPVDVQMLGAINRSVKLVASEAIDYGEELFTAANGKVQDAPTAPGTYYRVGRALKSVTTDGDVIEAIPYTPTEYVVL